MNETQSYSHIILNQNDLLEILPFGKTKLQCLLNASVLPVMKIGRDYLTTLPVLEQWITDNINKEIIY